MSERDGSTSDNGGHPNLHLTPEEKRLFGQLFQAADTESLGVVTGEIAVKFFEKSGLNPRILGEIWGIADTENRGLLTKVGFSVALRLIGQAQAGLHPRPELALSPGPLPRFDGLNLPFAPTAATPAPTAPATPLPPPPPTAARIPQLTDEDCKKFTNLFQVSGAVDGILPGDAAKQIFTRAKLPNQTLGLIWNLADRQQKGALTCPEFVVAMHLIDCCLKGKIVSLPSVLPPGLYEAAAGRPPIRSGADRRPPGRGIPSAGLPTAPHIPPQYSGSGVRAQSPLAQQFTPPPAIAGSIPHQATGDWAISAREKAEFDNLFLSVDRSGKGFITGEEAVPFFQNSKLSEDVLATIWDLADINKEGRLTKDEFAVAMYLIRHQRSRRDGKGLPDTLPANLIPPSMRPQLRPQLTGNVPTPAAFTPQPAVPVASNSMADLFGLDSFSSAAPASSTAAPTGGSGYSAFDSAFQSMPKSGSASANSPITSNSASLFALPQNKFVPNSGFGQMLAATATGGSTASNPRAAPSAMDDLLSDTDPEVNKKIAPDAMELANLSNQIGTLTKQTQELKNKRTSAEQELNTFNNQKHDIEMRLAQIKTLYERDAKELKNVEDTLAASKAETARLRSEYVVTEATYNELQMKRQDVAAQLEQDQRENLDLKERMKMVNNENQQLKQQLERLRLEAKQAKGLVAISRKQLATSEAERDKLKSEIDDIRSANATASQIISPVPGSPALSQASASTNPFYRGRSPPVPEPAFQSPFATGNSTFSNTAPAQPSANFDDIFSPTGYNAPPPGPAPVVAFGAGTQSGPSAPSASEESATSSVQVNPPQSTYEGTNSRPDTPTSNWLPGPSVTDSPARAVLSNSEERRPSASVRSDPGTEQLGRGFSRSEDNRSPFAPIPKNMTGPTAEGITDKRDPFSFSTPTPNLSSVPGAFPSPINPTPTGESTMSNKSRGSTMSRPEVLFASRNDPFGVDKSNVASKDDMDAAFSSFSSKSNLHQERQNTGGSGFSNANKEFPPIVEMDNTEDSDSDAGNGFEDSFTNPSSNATRPNLPRSVPVAANATAEANEFVPQSSTPLPGPNAMQSPPSYTSANLGSTGDKNPFPQEFKGLLPSRTDPFSHDAPTPGGGSNAVVDPSQSAIATSAPVNQSSNVFDAPFASSSTAAAAQSTPFASSALNQSAKPIDDFDEDAFGDLADAQEADGKGDHDDFGVLAARESFDEFNPVFDSPGPKAGTSMKPVKNVQDDDDDFAKFEFNIDSNASAQQTTGANHTASSQDWDAIFAGLEDSKQAPASRSQDTIGITGPNDSDGNKSGTALGTDSEPTTGGAALNEHEEKLTKLTGMGFSRENSLKALEKFDYNVESASNYLLDQ